MFVLSNQSSIANHFIAELRDVSIQKDSFRFRNNLERLGTLLAYEYSKSLPYQAQSVQTPLAETKVSLLEKQPVLATILRAGLPLYQGFLHVFDRAESAFIGAYRSPYQEDNSFDIIQGYTVTPDLNDKPLVLIDPMLATGQSLVSVYKSLEYYGNPERVAIIAAVASEAGIEYVQKHLPDASLWLGAIDPELNDKSYIVPGLGDAGDLAFGNKQ